MRDAMKDRLYRLLPGHIRAADALEGRPLQALMQILAGELEVVESDLDQLYDNWFIETCEDWVVPYIGDLVGARPLRPFSDGSLRAYVANTLSYRQGKGTLAVLEQAARDVSGWPTVGVEFFRQLIQSQNVNHVRPDNLATMSLRDADLASQTETAFGRAAHSIDIRAIRRGEGRYAIPNIGLMVWRIPAYSMGFAFDAPAGRLGGAEPAASPLGPGFRLFDPAGRPSRLFNRPRSETRIAGLAEEHHMPAPLRRRPVAADLRALAAGAPGAGRYFGAQPVLRFRLDDIWIAPADLTCCDLADIDTGGPIVWKRPAAAGKLLFDPERGRVSLHATDEGKTLEAAWSYGRIQDIGGGPYDRRASVADWIAPFVATDDPQPLWQIGVTRRVEEQTNQPDQGGPVVGSLRLAIKRWNQVAAKGARGVIVVMDDATYDEPLTPADCIIDMPAGARLAICAGAWPAEALAGGAKQRKAGVIAPLGRRPFVASSLRVRGAAAANEDAGALVLDGLWFGGKLQVEPGDLGSVELRHVTLGLTAAALGPGVQVKNGPAGDNARLDLHLHATLCGAIDGGKLAGRIALCDTILCEDRVADNDPAKAPLVLDAPQADLEIARATIFGKTRGRTLEADNAIFTGPLTIARRQEGCLRFCFLPGSSRTPRRYRCAPDLQLAQAKETLGRSLTAEEARAIRDRVRPAFTSTLNEDFAFAQLARRCPVEIAEGGEGGREMGVTHALANPMRAANIRDALDEYLPFGLDAGIIFVN